MNSLNKWLGLGNLIGDPEREQVGRGTVVSFTMGISERWKTEEGPVGQSTVYVRVLSTGNLGESVMKFLKKSRQVLVEGSLRTESYEDKDHVKHYRPVIRAADIQFLGGRDDDSQVPPR